MQYKFSENVDALQPSAIREILKFTGMPGVISFAAGNPAPEAFPVEEISRISAELLEKDPILALQYNITEGYPELRDILKARMAEQHCFDKAADDLITTSGAQQANELSCKVLLNRGDTMFCESPSFIGSLNAFRSYGVNLVGVELEEDVRHDHNRFRIIFQITFQPLDRRHVQMVGRLIQKHDIRLAQKQFYLFLLSPSYLRRNFAARSRRCI